MERVKVVSRHLLTSCPSQAQDDDQYADLKARWTPDVIAKFQEAAHEKYHLRSLEAATTLEERCRIKLGLFMLPNQAVSKRLRNPNRDKTGYVEDPAADLANKLRSAGLEKHVFELDEIGYTVIPPEVVAGDKGMAAYEDLIERMKQTVLRGAEEKTGVKPDEETGLTHKIQDILHCLVFADPCMEEALMTPALRLVMTYLLGKDCVLSSSTAFIKGPGKGHLGLHSDSFVPSAQLNPTNANATFVITPYEGIEGGAICFIPGSHKIGGNPLSSEESNPEKMGAVPIVCPSGSLVVWNGNTWHGAYERKKPGLRLNVTMFHCIPQVVTQERYRETVTEEMLQRNNMEFATLMGQKQMWGFGPEGSSYQRGDGPTLDRQRGIAAQPNATNPYRREGKG